MKYPRRGANGRSWTALVLAGVLAGGGQTTRAAQPAPAAKAATPAAPAAQATPAGGGAITVIDGGCPCMFAPTADFGHRVLRVVLAGRVPKQV